MTDAFWNPDTMLQAFQRMVRKQDYWRGYFGEECDGAPSDDEVEQWLEDARDALRVRDEASPARPL